MRVTVKQAKTLELPKTIVQLVCVVAAGLALTACETSGPPTAGDQQTPPVAGEAHNMPAGEDVAMLALPSRADVTAAQRQLAELGYDPGPVDGVLGKQTRIAIKHFQVDAEVDIDGELTPDMMALLKKAVRRRPAGESSAGTRSTAPSMPDSAGSFLDKAGPMYEPGDSYVYSDGRIETVSRVGPEQTHWEVSRGGVYTGYRNFILPPISWKSSSSQGETRIHPAAGEKWPPATGGPVEFAVGSTAAGEAIDAPHTWSDTWRCGAGGFARVKVSLGEFEAIPIECERASAKPGTWKKRIWYYVPDVGHYLRRVETIHGSRRQVTVDLVAVRLGNSRWPPAASGGLDWAVQEALETGDIGKSVTWRSSAIAAEFHITVKGPAPAIGGAACLRYEIRRETTDRVRLFPAIACKATGQERWSTPGLEPGSVPPESLKQP